MRAQASNPAPAPPAVQGAAAATAADSYITALAGNLGVSEQVLRDALKKTSLSELDKAVAAGTIDAARADKIRAEINAGTGPIFGIGGGRKGREGGHEAGGPEGLGKRGDSAALAAFFGITQDVLLTDLQGGKTLAQEAADHGKTRDELKAFLIAEFNARVDAEVAAGEDTAAKGAAEKQRFAAALDAMIDGTRPAHPARPAPGIQP